MDSYKVEIDRLVIYYSGGDDEKAKEIWEFYEKIIFLTLKVQQYNAHIAFLACKDLEEIAKECTRIEQRKKPLTAGAIRKRIMKVGSILKENFSERYGKT